MKIPPIQINPAQPHVSKFTNGTRVVKRAISVEGQKTKYLKNKLTDVNPTNTVTDSQNMFQRYQVQENGT